MDEVEDKFLHMALAIDFINMNLEFSKLRKLSVDEWWKNVTFVTGTSIEYSPKKNALSKMTTNVFVR